MPCRCCSRREPDALAVLKAAQGLQRFGGPWLAGGRFTAVDAFFAPVAFRVQSYQPPLGDTAAAYAQALRACNYAGDLPMTLALLAVRVLCVLFCSSDVVGVVFECGGVLCHGGGVYFDIFLNGSM